MECMFEHGILWVLLSILLAMFDIEINFTAYILAGFIVGCIGILTEYRCFTLILSLCFALLTVFFPFLAVYAGLIGYQIFFCKDTWFLYEKIILSVLILCFLYFCRNYMIQSIIFLLITSLACYMAAVRRELEILKEQAIHSRDAHVEQQHVLNMQYQTLCEKQNHEIQVATLSERNRIAREIHDNVGHTLSRSILQLGALLAVYKNSDLYADLYAQLLPLKDSLNEAMTNIRSSVHNLHKESIDFEVSFYRMTSEISGYELKLFCDLPKDLPIQVTYSFIAVIKEALTNIQRHSDADTISITARELSNYYQLIIEDNGHPRADIYKNKTGIGLKNMEERILSLQGLIYFSCQNGFRIFISVPKKNMEEKGE